MKNLDSMLLICVFSLFYYTSPVQSSELGFSFGSYSKESDLTGTIISYTGDQYWEYGTINPGDIYNPYDSQNFFPGSRGVEIGGRSTASLLGVIWIHKFFNPHFEVEHTLNGAFSAEKSAKPHTLIYSSNLNLIIPWNPEIFLVRINPFLGAGIGYVFNFSFGHNQGEKSTAYNYPAILGNNGNFQYNFGGGGKIKIHEEWWLRLSLRDYILPSMKKVNPLPKLSSSNSAITFPIPASLVYKEMVVRNTTHNISFAISLVHFD